MSTSNVTRELKLGARKSTALLQGHSAQRRFRKQRRAAAEVLGALEEDCTARGRTRYALWPNDATRERDGTRGEGGSGEGDEQSWTEKQERVSGESAKQGA